MSGVNGAIDDTVASLSVVSISPTLPHSSTVTTKAPSPGSTLRPSLVICANSIFANAPTVSP